MTLTSDDLESHMVVNVSSTLTNSTTWFVAALSLIVDVRTYVRTYGRTYVRTDVRTYGRTDGRTFLPGLLGHLGGDDLINPVKMSVCPYVRPYIHPQWNTMQPQTKYWYLLTSIRHSRRYNFQGHPRSGSSHVRLKVSKMTIFKVYLLCHFSTNQINSSGFWYMTKISKISRHGFLNLSLVIESRDFKICQKINIFFRPILM